MCPNLFLPLSLLLVTSLLAQIPISLCQENDLFDSCGKLIQCGSLQFGYPFYGAGRPHHCGYFGFEMICERDVPLITMNSIRYCVLAIDNTTRTLRVARDDLWDDLCPSNLYNTTLDFYIFDYGNNYQNISLYYGCSSNPGQASHLPNRFNCSANGTASFGFYLTRNAPFSNYANAVRCENYIIVPVNQSAFPSIADVNSTADNLRTAIADGFGLQWFAGDENCDRCTQSGGRCGHDSVTGLFSCYCTNGIYGLTCANSQGSDPDKRVKQRIIIITVLSVVSAIIIFSITAFYCHRRRYSLLPSNADQNIEVFMRNWGSFAPKEYNYSEITKITNSFSEKLGQGGYGSVYKGKLPDGRLVAVKVLNETKGSGEEFINEVSSISRTSHVNIVALLGFCYTRKRALIYEFMPNGSLDKFINKHGSPDADCLLEWKTLYQIAVSIARGLEYLHRGCNTRIVHFDIKPHNILLDEDFCPKISDFGLAKLSEKKESILSLLTARGTAGYIAPEVLSRQFGGVSHKSDVYSFGMMVLEMVGVRKNVVEIERNSDVYFPQWIYEHLELGKELNIQTITGEEEEQISRKMILVGLWCIQTNPSDRPSISKVVEMLEGSLDSIQIPPKPYFDSSAQKRVSNDSSTTFSS